MRTAKTSWRWDPFLWGSLALVLLIMGVIFSFSAQSAVQSGGSSGRIVSALIRRLHPDYGSLSPERQYELYLRLDFIVRKTAHLLEFTALGFALRLHLQAVSRYTPVRRPQLLAWGIGTLYAASDELHQLFSAGRAPRLTDVGIDSLGVILGILFLFFCARIIHKMRNRNM